MAFAGTLPGTIDPLRTRRPYGVVGDETLWVGAEDRDELPTARSHGGPGGGDATGHDGGVTLWVLAMIVRCATGGPSGVAASPPHQAW